MWANHNLILYLTASDSNIFVQNKTSENLLLPNIGPRKHKSLFWTIIFVNVLQDRSFILGCKTPNHPRHWLEVITKLNATTVSYFSYRNHLFFINLPNINELMMMISKRNSKAINPAIPSVNSIKWYAIKMTYPTAVRASIGTYCGINGTNWFSVKYT